MHKSEFDPTLFDFDLEFEMSNDDYNFWSTNPKTKSGVASYSLRYIKEHDWWTIYEIITHKNGKENELIIYNGYIPNNEFGFALLKNMDLEIPIIQRESKIDFLTD